CLPNRCGSAGSATSARKVGRRASRLTSQEKLLSACQAMTTETEVLSRDTASILENHTDRDVQREHQPSKRSLVNKLLEVTDAAETEKLKTRYSNVRLSLYDKRELEI